MLKDSKVPALGLALMGLLQGMPSSGYDLRKIFSSSSMKTYSDSPGAIYPALRRLERQSMIRSTIVEGGGLRRRQVFRLTPKGLAELKKWIMLPVSREDLLRGSDEILLRFAFSETAIGPAASLQLLKHLQTAIEMQLAKLHEEFRASNSVMPTSGRLAFECGIRGTECLLQWAEYAIKTYEKEERQKGGRS
jgi:DNA-binding PadR family transcriptional regulator